MNKSAIKFYYSIVLILAGFSVVNAYIEQSHVDSLAQSAIYSFHEAAAQQINLEQKQRSAVENAKGIARKLRSMAAGDPNEKYILWRVSELEGQIYLEENDIGADQFNKMGKTVNDIVGAFNGALNVARPTFKYLNELQHRMQAVHKEKGQELADAIYNRSQIVSKAVVNSFEQSLINNDSKTARADLVYCEDNQGMLTISLTQYSTMAARLQTRISVGDEILFVTREFVNAEAALARNQLQAAWQSVHVAQTRLAPLYSRMIRQEWDKLSARGELLFRKVELKEDSIIALNLAILKKQGIQAASEFLDNTTARKVAQREKIALVSNAIMAQVVAQRETEVTPISKEIAALTATESTSALSPLDDLKAQAKRRATSRLALNKGATTQSEEIRQQQLALLQDGIRNRREQSAKQPPPLTHVEQRRRQGSGLAQQGIAERQTESMRLAKERSRRVLVEIYASLESKKIADAYNLFVQDREMLKLGLPVGDYDTLTTRVTLEYEKIRKK